ncbi:MAG: TIGR03749 family integrating conjugative element protein, partial [Gammaproteobacteria bacterium]
MAVCRALSSLGLNVPGLLVVLLAVVLLPRSAVAEPTADAPERVAWRKVPIGIQLLVGTERLVHFPEAVKFGVPPELQGLIRVQSVAGTLYLLAHQPFTETRVIVRGMDDGRVYLLDLSAATEGDGRAPLEIYLPNEAKRDGDDVTEDVSPPPSYGYVTLTRFAAQQLYAPARLLQDLPGIVRVPVKREPLSLVRGDTVEALPLVAWRAGDLYLTAAKLTNKTFRPQTLDPRTLRGRWLTATFQHNRLHAAGSEADRTAVYLISRSEE